MKFQVSAIALGCIALLSGCGGGCGGSSDGGQTQTIAFDFAGGEPVPVPPAVTTKKMAATASSNGPITYASNTPDTGREASRVIIPPSASRVRSAPDRPQSCQ